MQDLKEGQCPEISIVIPVYNRERTLGRCVKSLLAQIDDRIEIVLVDDGSADATREILENYAKDCHITVAYQEHGGVSKARNYGMGIAVGKYISFIDSDDFVEDNYVGALLEAVESDCDIVVFDGWYKVDEKGNVCEVTKEINEKGKWPAGVLYPYLIDQRLNNVWGKAFKKSIVQKYNIRFDESMLISEDFMFVTDYLYYCKTARIGEKIGYYYEYSQDGAWSAKPQHIRDIIKSYDRICEFIKEKPNVFDNSICNRQLMHCRFLRHICSIVVGLYDNGELSEECVRNLLDSKFYIVVTNERYHIWKYNVLKHLMRQCQWKSLSLVFKIKGIK